MKKVTIFFIILCFSICVTSLLAQVPSGTYLPCNELSKSSYIEQIVFGANKVMIYYGTMGISIGSQEYEYTVSSTAPINETSIPTFEYNRTTDKITFGKAIINTVMKQMGNNNSTEPRVLPDNVNGGLVFNKSGNCNSNMQSNNNIWIIIKDNSQKQNVAVEIINNYMVVSDTTIIPRLDRDKARKSGKYTEAEIAGAILLLHNELNNQLQKILISIDVINALLSKVGENSVGIANSIYSLFTFDPTDITGNLVDWLSKLWKLPTFGDVFGPDISKHANSLTNFLGLLSQGVKVLIVQNDTINK